MLGVSWAVISGRLSVVDGVLRAASPLVFLMLAAVLMCASQVWAEPMRTEIFNGSQTFDYPFAGLLLHRAGPTELWRARCSLSLIGPSRVLTAAHCVCDAYGSQCQPGRAYAPHADDYRVLLQHAGVLEVASIALPIGFDFPRLDLAVLLLDRPVMGIAPVVLAQQSPATGTLGTIVGFGATSSYGGALGVKRAGDVVTGSCGDDLAADAFVCWESDGNGAGGNTCVGDSGGPVLLTDGDGTVSLVGVISGGYGTCDGDDLAFSTAVAVHQDIIDSLGGLPSMDTAAETQVAATHSAGQLSPGAMEQSLSIQVPAGGTRLVVVGNAVDSASNDYRLRVAHGALPATDNLACDSDQRGVYEDCVIASPGPGTWYAVYGYKTGLGGDAQLSATAYRVDCGLDIDADGRADALTDGLLVARHLDGRSGDELVGSVLGVDATRTSPEAVVAYLDSPGCRAGLDLDQDGERLAGTDGMLVLRYLFGFSGDALVQGALSPTATRVDPAAIAEALDSMRR